MSIFSRIFKIGQAAANKVVEKFETPELMLDQAIRDKTEQIAEAKRSVQQCIVSERQAKALLDEAVNGQKEWESKAEQALLAGKEDLAGKALGRSAEFEAKVATLQPQWETQRKGVDELKAEIRKFEDELAEFKRNKNFIIAQSKAAAVKKDIYEAKAKMSKKSTSADDLMARMKAKAQQASMEADAAQEMATDMEGGDSLEKEFADLGTTSVDSKVADKLAAMKAKLGK